MIESVDWEDDPWSDVFDADYLHFYAARLGAEPSDRETDLIVRLLALEPGTQILDAPCGHGRIANRLAARGYQVVGLDENALFLERARRDAAELGASKSSTYGATCGSALVRPVRRRAQLVHVVRLLRRRGQPAGSELISPRAAS